MHASGVSRVVGVTERKLTDIAVPSQPVPEGPPVALPSFFRLKRWIDVVGSFLLTVLLFPIFIVAGGLVLLDVGRPILFWQARLGWKGRSFLIYKFRTLRAPLDSEGNATLVGRRPSAIGRFCVQLVSMSCRNR
jgi:lipopolysaccharide/colanic/teichoic acid biosynthesis glycosyltransferase